MYWLPAVMVLPRGVGVVADPGDAVGLPRPFLHPHPVEIGLAGARLQPLRDQVDLGHGGRAIGHHALDDLHGVAPAQIAREGDRPVRLARCRNHPLPPQLSFFHSPLRAGEQLAVVVAPGHELRADRQSVRPLEHRQRHRRHVQRGPDLKQRHAGEGGHADRRLAERRGRQQDVDVLEHASSARRHSSAMLLGLDIALEVAVDAVVQPAAAQACR